MQLQVLALLQVQIQSGEAVGQHLLLLLLLLMLLVLSPWVVSQRDRLPLGACQPLLSTYPSPRLGSKAALTAYQEMVSHELSGWEDGHK